MSDKNNWTSARPPGPGVCKFQMLALTATDHVGPHDQVNYTVAIQGPWKGSGTTTSHFVKSGKVHAKACHREIWVMARLPSSEVRGLTWFSKPHSLPTEVYTRYVFPFADPCQRMQFVRLRMQEIHICRCISGSRRMGEGFWSDWYCHSQGWRNLSSIL